MKAVGGRAVTLFISTAFDETPMPVATPECGEEAWADIPDEFDDTERRAWAKILTESRLDDTPGKKLLQTELSVGLLTEAYDTL